MNLEPGKTVPATPVPLDAELHVAYDAYMAEEPELAPMSLEMLPRIRAEADVAVVALDDLSRGGCLTVFESSVPSLDGDPEIPLLICSPVGEPASRPALYYMHGTTSGTAATTASAGGRCSAPSRAVRTCRSTLRPPAPPT